MQTLRLLQATYHDKCMKDNCFKETAPVRYHMFYKKSPSYHRFINPSTTFIPSDGRIYVMLRFPGGNYCILHEQLE